MIAVSDHLNTVRDHVRICGCLTPEGQDTVLYALDAIEAAHNEMHAQAVNSLSGTGRYKAEAESCGCAANSTNSCAP